MQLHLLKRSWENKNGATRACFSVSVTLFPAARFQLQQSPYLCMVLTSLKPDPRALGATPQVLKIIQKEKRGRWEWLALSLSSS